MPTPSKVTPAKQYLPRVRPRAYQLETKRPRLDSRAVETHTIVVLEGDETGQELLEETLRVLAADVVGLRLELPRYDLSLENRRATQNEVVHEAAGAIREHGLGLKAATVTPEGKDDVQARTASCGRTSEAT